MAAPCSSSIRTTSGYPCATAHISAVCPWEDSFALTPAAPWSRSLDTASALPAPAQVMSTVSPIAVAASGSAPASRSFPTTAALRLMQASASGVTP